MRIIAHRANFAGPGSGDNRRSAIETCIDLGFEVELDVWGFGDGLWIGHDGPGWECAPDVLRTFPMLAHAKNIEAANILGALEIPFFCLERDQFALCSTGEIWTNYGVPSVGHSIVCSPELVGADETIASFLARHKSVSGVCTDHPAVYQGLLASSPGASPGTR